MKIALHRTTGDCSLALILLAVMAGCTPAVAGTPMPGEPQAPVPTAADATITPPIALAVDIAAPPLTLDPALVGPLDAAGNDLVENLFSGLTSIDPATGMVSLAIARSWEQAPDHVTWTIYLRDDVQWARIDQDTGQAVAVRPVTAPDVVAGLRRACQAETAAPMASALFLIAGCADIYAAPAGTLTGEIIEQRLGVRVLNDVAVEVRLRQESAALLGVLAMPVARPVPVELLAEHGTSWATPDVMWSSGPFILAPGNAADGYTLARNPFFPADLSTESGPDTVTVTFGGVSQADLRVLPRSGIGSADLRDPATRLLALPRLGLVVFAYDVFPFEKPAVRRAFALALDRQTVIDTVLRPGGVAALPAYTTAPPGSANALSDPRGVAGFDGQAARDALREGGYPDCLGFPPVTVLADEAALSLALATEYVRIWEQQLGCTDGVFTIEQMPFWAVQSALSLPIQNRFQRPRPGLTLVLWQGESLDASHWYNDLLGCREQFPHAYLNPPRPCAEGDTALLRAAIQYDPAGRAADFGEAAAAFFGSTGEFPVVPVYHEARIVVARPGLDAPRQAGGSLRFDRLQVQP